MKKIVFQGDSVTDVGRNRERANSMGEGYPRMIAGRLGYERPAQYEFVNRGIGGNRVVDLYARWKIDCLNLEPDYISILIGVNDVWHEYESKNGVAVKQYEKIYTMLLEDTLERLPNVKLILMEPFILHGPVADADWAFFGGEIAKRQKVVQELAKRYNTYFLPLQSEFDKALSSAPELYWTLDGVHPSAAGHALIADRWMTLWNTIDPQSEVQK